ncbi:MAG: hypothetical protein R3F61_07565 [Myxococcota bacterium]
MSERSGKDPGRTLTSSSELHRPAAPGRVAGLPPVEALVGADAPCDPIPAPPEDRKWDSESGRWKRRGIEIPPDPAGMTYPPGTPSPAAARPLDLGEMAETAEVDASSDAEFQGSASGAAELEPAPERLPLWAFVVVALMFGLGLVLGLAFAAL